MNNKRSIKNDQTFMEYLEKKNLLILTGKNLIQTLKDDYSNFCEEKDEVCFEDWCGYKEEEIKEDVLYVIDSEITAPEEASSVKKKYDNAKKLIMEFLNEEYEDEMTGANYAIYLENLCMINNYPEKIDVAHTTTEDGEHDIDVSIDLINNRVIRCLDGEEIKIRKYASLVQLINNQLVCLDFDELIGQPEVEKHLEDFAGLELDRKELADEVFSFDNDIREDYKSKTEQKEKFKLSKGDKIKTPLSDNTIVLEVQGDDALLFNGSQFVKANGFYEHEGEVVWHYGNYYDKLPNRDDIFPEKKSFEETKEELSRMMNDNYRGFVKSLVSIERNIQDEDVLDKVYDQYMNADHMNLTNEQFEDFELEVSKDNIIETNKEMEL